MAAAHPAAGHRKSYGLHLQLIPKGPKDPIIIYSGLG